jgi:hypothetical protein
MCNSNVFGSCIIHILYTEGAEIKKNKFRRQKVTKQLKYLKRRQINLPEADFAATDGFGRTKTCGN